MHDAENGLLVISECEWPSFLYPEDRSADIEDDMAGLFRGYLLPMVILSTSKYKYRQTNQCIVGFPANLYWSKVGIRSQIG